MTHSLDDIKVCAFDAYGTLFDVHSAVGAHRARLGEQADSVSMMWRTKQLEYTWLRSLMRDFADFWQVTGDALDYALDVNSIDDGKLRSDLMQSYLELKTYDEVVPVLSALQQAEIKTAVLSNGATEMLNAANRSAGISELLDANISVDQIQVFKPDPAVYELVTKEFSVEPRQVLFQSSNAWDAAGAAAFGFKVLWVNRFGQRPERLPSRPDYEAKDLTRLLELLNLKL